MDILLGKNTENLQGGEMRRQIKEETFSLMNVGMAGGILCCYNEPGFPLYYVNDGLIKYMDYSREEFEEAFSESGLSVVWHEDLEAVVGEVTAALAEGRDYNIRHRVLTKRGALKWLQVKGRCLVNAQGREIVMNLSMDISDLVDMQHQLTIKERRLSVQNERLREQEEKLAAQNEELTAQNEELTAQNEELTAQSELMEAQNAELTAQSELLSAQNEELAFRKRRLEEQARLLAVSEERFRVALEKTSNIIFDYDMLNDRIANFSRSGADVEFLAGLGGSGSSGPDGMAPDAYQEEFGRALRQIREGNRQAECEIKAVLEDQRAAWYKISLTGIMDERGIPVRAVGLVEDVTKLREMENAYAREEQYRKAVLAGTLATYEVNLTKDRIEKYQVESPRCLVPDPNESYSGIIVKMAQERCLPMDQETYRELFSRENILRRYAQGECEFSAEYRVRGENGSAVWLRAVLWIVKDYLSDEVKGFLYIADIDRRKKKELELIRRSERDSMTGVYNKNTVIRQIKRALKTKEGNEKGTFYLLDVDRFKEVNDTYGHPFGDRVLTRVAGILKERFRGEIIGRIGGDEFCVYLAQPDRRKAREQADEVCRLVRSMRFEEQAAAGISCSVGISECAGQGKSFEQLYREADKALYQRKQDGRNGCQFYA